MTGDDEIAVHSPEGPRATRPSTSPSRASATPTRRRRRSRQRPGRRLRAHLLRHLRGLRRGHPVPLLLRLVAPRARDRPARRCGSLTLPLVTTWEDRVAQALEKEFGEREGRQLFKRYVRPETRSGLYREVDAARTGARRRRGTWRRSRAGSRCGSSRAPPRSVRPQPLLDARARAHRHPEDAAEPRPHRHRGAARCPSRCPTAAAAFSTGSSSRRRRSASPPSTCGGDRFVDALRALDEERATDDPLNGLDPPGGPPVARRRGAAHAAQPPAPDPHPLQRGDGERRAAPQQRGRGRALQEPSPRASTRLSSGTGRPRWRTRTPG